MPRRDAPSLDDDRVVAIEALREVLADPRAGVRVRTSAATALGRLTARRPEPDEVTPPDPMRDLELAERIRQLRSTKARARFYDTLDEVPDRDGPAREAALDALEADLDEFGGARRDLRQVGTLIRRIS